MVDTDFVLFVQGWVGEKGLLLFEQHGHVDIRQQNLCRRQDL